MLRLMNQKHLLLGAALICCTLFLPAQETWDFNRCYEYARETNLTLQQARYNQVTSGINLKQAKAARHPSLGLNINTNWAYGKGFDPFTNDRVEVNTNGFNTGANLNLPIFNGFNIVNSIEQAKINQQIASLDLSDAENVLGLNIATAYLAVLQNQEIVVQREAQVESSKEQRDRMKKLVDAGTMAMTNFLELDAQLALDETNLVDAMNQLQMAYLQLQQLMNLDPTDNFQVVKPNLPEVGSTLELEGVSAIYDFAEKNQPNIQSTDLSIKSAEKEIAIARSFALPSLSFGSSLGTGYGKPIGESIDISETLNENLNYGFSLGLNVPIYSRRQSRSGVERAEIQLEQARLQATQARLDLRQTIEQAFLDVRNTFAQYQQVTRQINSQQLAFDNAKKQLDLGVINSVDYILAQNNLQMAMLNQIQLKYQYHFQTKVLDFYQGKSLDF